MNKETKLSLVNGTFTSQEALEVLMNLYSSKIKFHELKNFSSNERFGYDDAHSLKRIPELEESKRIIATLIREFGDSEGEFTIQSDVVITINKSMKRSGEKVKLKQKS